MQCRGDNNRGRNGDGPWPVHLEGRTRGSVKRPGLARPCRGEDPRVGQIEPETKEKGTITTYHHGHYSGRRCSFSLTHALVRIGTRVRHSCELLGIRSLLGC